MNNITQSIIKRINNAQKQADADELDALVSEDQGDIADAEIYRTRVEESMQRIRELRHELHEQQIYEAIYPNDDAEDAPRINEAEFGLF